MSRQPLRQQQTIPGITQPDLSEDVPMALRNAVRNIVDNLVYLRGRAQESSKATVESTPIIEQDRLKKTTILYSAFELTENEEVVLVDATAGAVTITMPPAQLNIGRMYYIKKIDVSANAVTISGNGVNIDGAATAALAAQYNFRVLVAVKTLTADTSQWYVLGS